MYYAVVGTLMVAFPLLSIAIEAAFAGSALMPLVGKWFAFWAVGARSFSAGVRQVLQPQYTAQVILGLESGESPVLVRELGFANLAIGTVDILSHSRAGGFPPYSPAACSTDWPERTMHSNRTGTRWRTSRWSRIWASRSCCSRCAPRPRHRPGLRAR